jgi:hypothetical protein
LERNDLQFEREKTVEMAIEQDKEVKRILEKVAVAKQADLEAWETALRAAVLAADHREFPV